jgi:hypothetical protein
MDPDETPLGPWRLARVQEFDGDNAQIWLPEYNGYGCIFFLVQHQTSGAILFTPGYEPELCDYIRLEFYKRESASAPLPASMRTWATPETNPTFLLVPITNTQDLQGRKKMLFFLLNQETLWNDLAAHYRAGKDTHAIGLICDCMVLALDSLPDEDKVAATREHQKTIEWCLKVARAHAH